MKIRNLFIIFIVLIFTSNGVLALTITKVSGPKTSPWIEFFNDTEEVKNIENIKLYTNNAVKPSAHGVNLNERALSFQIPAKSYFILAVSPDKKLFDNLSCPVFKTSFSLIEGEVLAYDGLTYETQTTDSLTETSCSVDSPNKDTTTGTSTFTKSTDKVTEVIKYIYVPMNNQMKYGDIQLHLPTERVVPALADVEHKIKVTDSNNKIINDLDFHWSFGDGGEKVGKDVSYIYSYPGEYVLIASADGFTSAVQARMNVKVVEPNIEINKVGAGGKENFIELKNNTDYDLFLSNFYLKIGSELFKIPKNFLLAKNKITKISGDALGFKLPAQDISLLYPNQTILKTFQEDIKNGLATPTLSIENSSSSIMSSDTKTTIINQPILKEEQKSTNNLTKIQSNLVTKPINTVKTEPMLVKKLVLIDNVKPNTTANYQAKDISKEREDKNVDTGIIKWLKSLIY